MTNRTKPTGRQECPTCGGTGRWAKVHESERREVSWEWHNCDRYPSCTKAREQRFEIYDPKKEGRFYIVAD